MMNPTFFVPDGGSGPFLAFETSAKPTAPPSPDMQELVAIRSDTTHGQCSQLPQTGNDFDYFMLSLYHANLAKRSRKPMDAVDPATVGPARHVSCLSSPDLPPFNSNTPASDSSPNIVVF